MSASNKKCSITYFHEIKYIIYIKHCRDSLFQTEIKFKAFDYWSFKAYCFPDNI